MTRSDQAIITWLARISRGLRRRLRTFYYSRALKSMGKGCQICDGVLILCTENVSMGERVIVNDGVIIQSCDGATITIGNRVVFSYGVCVVTGGLDISASIGFCKHVSAPVVIEDGVWIGAKAIVLPGVTIGAGAVVAAGSVITHSIPQNVVVAGVPARVIKAVNKQEVQSGDTSNQ